MYNFHYLSIIYRQYGLKLAGHCYKVLTIYSSASVDGIEILGEKIAEITSQYPSTDLLVAGDLNARTKDHFDYIPDDDIQYVFGWKLRIPVTVSINPENHAIMS